MKKYIKPLSCALSFGLLATTANAASTVYNFELGQIPTNGTYSHTFNLDDGVGQASNGGYNYAIYFELLDPAMVGFFSNSFTGTAIINEYILNYDNDPVHGYGAVNHWSGVNTIPDPDVLLSPPIDVSLGVGKYQFKYESFLKILGDNNTNGTFGTFNGGLTVASLPVSAVPEPETYALMLAGLALVGFSARRRQA